MHSGKASACGKVQDALLQEVTLLKAKGGRTKKMSARPHNQPWLEESNLHVSAL
jgi:hypothetical protein